MASTRTNALIENVLGSALGVQVTGAHRQVCVIGRFAFVARCCCTLSVAAHGSEDHPPGKNTSRVAGEKDYIMVPRDSATFKSVAIVDPRPAKI